MVVDFKFVGGIIVMLVGDFVFIWDGIVFVK